MKKFKKWIRKKYVIWKYEHNWNTNKLVVLKEEDRQYGLTLMLIKECVLNNYVLFVPDTEIKKYIAHEAYIYGQLGLMPAVTEEELYGRYLMCKTDILNNKLRGKRNIEVLVDNSCTYKDVLYLYYECSVRIVNGFVCIDMAA